MKRVEKAGSQGDVWFIRVDKIPNDAKEVKSGKEVIVAHSETGHHHVAVADNVRLFNTADPLVSYVDHDGDHVDVNHLRDFHTHESIRLLNGPWKIIRQRESTPEGWVRQVVD